MTGGARPILVIGDVIDDIIVVPAGPIRPETDTLSTIVSTQGGSAANVAAWLGSLGAAVRFVGRVGAGDGPRQVEPLAEDQHPERDAEQQPRVPERRDDRDRPGAHRLHQRRIGQDAAGDGRRQEGRRGSVGDDESLPFPQQGIEGAGNHDRHEAVDT